jgi:Ca-activated chloride channel homolog
MLKRLFRLAACWCGASLVSVASVALAQGLAINAPRLVIATPTEAPVALRAVKVHTEISGRSAITEVTLTFYNPNPRQLEGELQFPLQEGQTVVGMAMEVGGMLREAVAVDKARGEAVFEDVTRTRIDPALLAQTQGNNYKLRVYPIEARSEKTVRIRHAQWLAQRGGRSVYRLPLAFGNTVMPLAATIVVDGVAMLPTVSARGVELELPAQTAASVTTQSRDGRDYFLAQLAVPTRTAPRPLPRIATLVWDSSGSGAQRDHASEFALLGAYIARARDIEVRLTRVRDAAEPAQRFTIANGDWRALRAALESTVYDGATDLGAFVPERESGEVLLFSDGLSNFGAQHFVESTVPVYAVSAAARNDAARLRGIAEASGGRFIDLLQDGARASAAALLNASTRVVAIAAEGGAQLVAASVYPSDGGVTIAGELSAPNARLMLTLQHPGGRRETVELPLDDARRAGSIAAQAWARLRIAALDAEYDRNRAEIRGLGAAFGIVTRETSLLILDRAQDYARFSVTPPPELAAEVATLRAQMKQAAQAGEKAQLDRVARLFEAKQAWWQREFPKGAPPRPPEANDAPPIAGAVMQGSRRSPQEPRTRESVGRPAAMGAPMAATAPLALRDALSADAAAPMRKSAGAPLDAGPATTIRLRPARADAPYAARLRAARSDDLYNVYLDERGAYVSSTAFLLDVADVLYERGQPALATRVLSNLAEMDLENRQVLRILAARLVQAGRADLALPVLRKVLVLAPDEPQSHRDLGLALAAAHQPQAAIDALYDVVRRPWPRFPEIELIALAELNAIVATRSGAHAQPLDTSRIDARLLKNLTLDLRATLSWDADNTDIDLWVTDPNGERVFYGNALSYQGGRVSSDITSGYGPEEFSLRHAKPGKYQVHANFYGHSQQIVTNATTLQLVLETGFGSAQQKEQRVTLRLKNANEQVFVGEFEVQRGE